jgi:hypothetical protein
MIKINLDFFSLPFYQFSCGFTQACLFLLLLARSARTSNICIYLHSGDPHKVGYSLNNRGHNISFGKCTRALTILHPPGPIELSNQSTAGMRFCCAFHQPQQNVQKCWAKTILLHQTGMS